MRSFVKTYQSIKMVSSKYSLLDKSAFRKLKVISLKMSELKYSLLLRGIYQKL